MTTVQRVVPGNANAVLIEYPGVSAEEGDVLLYPDKELADSKILKNFWRGWFASTGQPKDMIFHCVTSAHDEPSPDLKIFAL